MGLIMRIVGARPQFMQVPTVSKKLKEFGHHQILLHTGQHYDTCMSGDMFASLNLPDPDISLHIDPGMQGFQTGRMLGAIEESIVKNKPDAVLIDGDTNTTLAAALAAQKLQVPVFHIEAGLRSGIKTPPEEINRILVDQCSSLNFSPIPEAVTFLKNEGLGNTATLTGDVLLDCMLHYETLASYEVFNSCNLKEKEYYVLTIHRASNTIFDGENSNIFTILKGLSRLDKTVIFPVHPRTKPLVEKFINNGGNLGAIKLIAPIPYLEMLGLLKNAAICITDSGGLQRESLWLGVPTAICMDYTPWTLFVERNWVYQTPLQEEDLSQIPYRVPTIDPKVIMNHFGNGNASQRISESITNFLK